MEDNEDFEDQPATIKSVIIAGLFWIVLLVLIIYTINRISL